MVMRVFTPEQFDAYVVSMSAWQTECAAKNLAALPSRSARADMLERMRKIHPADTVNAIEARAKEIYQKPS
jgi:hypothetical protein